MNYDVVIIGGGIVGVTLACALGNIGLKIAVVEKQRWAARGETSDYDLRVSAVTLSSRALFENLGVWDAMELRRVHAIREMHVWDAEGNIHFNSADIGEACLGFIVENSVMLDALMGGLGRLTNIDYLAPADIAAMQLGDEDVDIVLKDGRALRSRLLVGADGAQSQVRALANIATRERDYAQVAIVGTVKTEGPNKEAAWQHFLPTGPLAFLPLDAQHCSIVWSVDTAVGRELLGMSDEEFRTALQAAFGDALGRIVSVGARAGFPLSAAHAERYVHPRVAIVGDAAHRVHPLAGQGLNLGLADAATLAEVIAQARAAQRDIGELRVLRRYERWRKGDNLAMLTVTDGFDRLFRSKASAIKTLRNAGLTAVDTLTPLKNRIMCQAAGLRGDLPPLSRRRVMQ